MAAKKQVKVTRGKVKGATNRFERGGVASNSATHAADA